LPGKAKSLADLVAWEAISSTACSDSDHTIEEKISKFCNHCLS
jgi:hypothetical protein